MKNIQFNFLVWLLLLCSSLAQGGQPNIDAIASLPIEEIKAVETNGEIFFMSNNGRYVFRGQLTDTWHKRSLDTMQEIEYASNHIDLDLMGLPLDKLNTITIGGGSQRVVAFVDPKCSFCKTLIREALNKTDKYTFKLVVVPALGEDSNNMSKALFCSADKSPAIEKFLAGDLKSLPQKDTCDTKHYDLTLTVAQLIGIDHVPFILSPDGRYRSGTGEGFWKWIERKS